MPWRLIALRDELRGLWLRARQGLPTFCHDMPAVQALGLPAGCLPPEAAEEAATRVLTGMLLAGAAYPQSQREAVMYLAQEAREQLKEQQAFRARLEEEHLARLRAMAEFQRRETEFMRRHAAHKYAENFKSTQGTSHQRTTPPPSPLDWRKTLGVSPDEQDLNIIKRAYRKKASQAHPDKGGSEKEMAMLNAAMSLARKSLGHRVSR